MLWATCISASNTTAEPVARTSRSISEPSVTPPRLSQSMARGITKAGVATEMVDLLSVDTQELVEIIGRNAGVALLAPPSDARSAQDAVATVLSAVKPKKQKVRGSAAGVAGA